MICRLIPKRKWTFFNLISITTHPFFLSAFWQASSSTMSQMMDGRTELVTNHPVPFPSLFPLHVTRRPPTPCTSSPSPPTTRRQISTCSGSPSTGGCTDPTAPDTAGPVQLARRTPPGGRTDRTDASRRQTASQERILDLYRLTQEIPVCRWRPHVWSV